MEPPQIVDVGVNVDFRGLNVGVAHQHLHVPDVGPAVD
jgi:hypothetical protein